jgi:hypothetical protein
MFSIGPASLEGFNITSTLPFSPNLTDVNHCRQLNYLRLKIARWIWYLWRIRAVANERSHGTLDRSESKHSSNTGQCHNSMFNCISHWHSYNILDGIGCHLT